LWTSDNYNDDIYVCVTAYFVHAGWKLQRKIVGFKFMLFPNDVTSVAETIEFCFSELKIDKKVIGITLDNDTLNNDEYEASMPDSLKTVLHDKCKVLWDGEFCQAYYFRDILNSSLRAATREISKTTMIYQKHVVQPDRSIILLVVIPAQRLAVSSGAFCCSPELYKWA